ncbi:hypothetical protein ACIA5D_46355 [Actinoplanes sp. NPDC051513]|uniref:hypothetical protein n=1 Tax=Actinoplanes sp. NPDC051513 TaxID=3363908 RepID=UPI0037B07ACC
MVLAFALSLGVALWLQPFTWQVEPALAGLTVYGLFAAASVAVPAGAYALIAEAYRRRPVAWDSDADAHRFSVPSSPRQAVAMIIWGWVVARLVPVERVPNQDRARIAQLGLLTTVLLLIVVVLLVDAVLRSMMNRPGIALSPDGLSLHRRARRDEIRWDELLPGGPPRPAKRNPATIKLRRSPTAQDRPPGGCRCRPVDCTSIRHSWRTRSAGTSSTRTGAPGSATMGS